MPGAVVVFEVLSASTSRTDRILKVREYAAVVSIPRYVILESASIGLTVMEREWSDEIWRVVTFTSGDILHMPEIGIEIPWPSFTRELLLTTRSLATRERCAVLGLVGSAAAVLGRKLYARAAAYSRVRRELGPALLAAIQAVLAGSPFHGEGHRKIWARLRLIGVRTSKRRVLRLMRENNLLAPSRVGSPRGPRSHDGTIIPETVDTMWGTDLTTTITGEGPAAVFVAVDHCSVDCVGIHAAPRATRFEALEPIRQGVRDHFGGFARNIANGLSVRHDHGSQYMSDAFQKELEFLGANLDEAADALGPERGLQKPPLPPPQLALAGGEPFPEDHFQPVMKRVTAVIAVVLLQHIMDVGGVGEHEDRVPAGHGEAHHVAERPGAREHRERVAREGRQDAEDGYAGVQDRRCGSASPGGNSHR